MQHIRVRLQRLRSHRGNIERGVRLSVTLCWLILDKYFLLVQISGLTSGALAAKGENGVNIARR